MARSGQVSPAKTGWVLALALLLVTAPAALSAQSGADAADAADSSPPGAEAPVAAPELEQEAPAEPRPVATMSELMVRILYPYSDAVFYITTRTPESEEEWLELESQTLMLAESANLLMMAGRSWGGEERAEEWRRDALLLLEAGEAAYEAAKARDVDALAGLNNQLYESCVRCHVDFRPDYGR